MPLEVISIGVFHVGTAVYSAACDPWQGLALACVLHGSCSSLERAFWLFCEIYTRAFGVSLVYYSVHLQCIPVFLFKCQTERAGGLPYLKAQVKHGLSLRSGHPWKVLSTGLNFLLPKFK